MAEIPGKKSLRFYEKKWVAEAIAIVPSIIAASVGAWVSLNDPSPDKQVVGWVLVVGAIWLGVASILKVWHAYLQDKEQKSRLEYDGLLGALHVLYSSVSQHLNFTNNHDGRLRVTIHRVMPATKPDADPEQTEQILPYIGGAGKGPGRKFSVRSGIVGRVVREQAPYASTRADDDYETFIHDLVTQWSYTEQEARALSPDRKAWMAVPIFGSSHKVIAVVYLDSNDRTLFTEAVRDLIINGSSGIARYVDERYK